ncbi:MAG: tetratricopeptide repeat protein [Clostridium sp.]|nr:tetratricopeptide repeat protein [Bacteroides sp.]MCM1198950.1 tetratricopeptide repeat protein [Clostridium sp.]
MAVSRYILAVASALLMVHAVAFAQVDRRDVRNGNRDFRKGNYKEAEIDYRKALIKDSTSFAANYNLGNTMYRNGDIEQARNAYGALKDAAPDSGYAADYYYNLGNAAVAAKDWKGAVDAYMQSLLRNPGDLDAKENYIYAKEMLKNQQDNQDQDNQNNQDQNQDNRKDQDQNGGNEQDNDQEQNQDQGQDGQDKQDSQQQGRQPNMTPQAAQQLLQAIQAKEKETQDKVNKEKAEAMKSRQKEKNW